MERSTLTAMLLTAHDGFEIGFEHHAVAALPVQHDQFRMALAPLSERGATRPAELRSRVLHREVARPAGQAVQGRTGVWREGLFHAQSSAFAMTASAFA